MVGFFGRPQFSSLAFAALLVPCVGSAQTPAPRKTVSTPWSFHAPTLPAVPSVRDAVWPQTPIDAFILARLEREGLAPAPPADRTTLLRRMTLDLLGLLPEPWECDDFTRDETPGALQRVVDRLLGSPRHGERWGRHWLDVVRFSESDGFEYDKIRERSWPYRDWVIASLNGDMPFDRFAVEQIAGDVADPVSAESIAATGFLTAGPWDEPGNGQQGALMRARVREEDLEEMVAAVGQTFLGVTIQCARCHDHKFDPIAQRDYYRVKAVFEGVRHGDRPALSDAAFRALPEDARKAVPAIYAAVSTQPVPTHILERGDAAKPGSEVSSGALVALSGAVGELGLAPGAGDAERRLRFAGWVTSRRNPLTARVIVNRVWQHHFGRGLVATPSDFGTGGEPPTHPELLDWLAVGLMDHAWSLKWLHREILLSATYAQSSAATSAALERDAESRLRWRFATRRLEAETIRDVMLQASGELNLAMGGRGFRPFSLKIFGSHHYTYEDRDGPEFSRRSIYRHVINSLRHPLLDALDCPDPSTKTPARGLSTTPIQSLALMNDAFVLRQCERLAARIQRETGGEPRSQALVAYRRTLNREPTPEENARAHRFIQKNGLVELAWVLLNSSEFLYLR